jgi:hypothetical protein
MPIASDGARTATHPGETFAQRAGLVSGRQDNGCDHNTASHNGKTRDTGCCIVFGLRNGRIVDGREHSCDLYNRDAFRS